MLDYKVFWLRELPGGQLGGEYGGAPIALAGLPINETLAGRIHRLTPAGAAMSLHLPFLSLKDRQEWPARQLELPVAADTETGRITVGDEADHQYAALLAGPALGATSPPVVFREERIWQAGDWDPAVQPMMRAHKIDLDPSWKPTGPVRVRWNIELPAHLAGAWAGVPHRREAMFLEQFRGVSTSVQRALRAWRPYQYFSRLERYGKPHYAHAYMVYANLPSFPSRRKTQLTFHVLEPQRVMRSLTRLGKPVAGELRRAQARMTAAGMLPGPDYRIEDAGAIVKAMQKLPRVFGGLVALEAFVVEELVLFAATAHHLNAGPPQARTLVEPALGLLHAFRCRLSRSQGGETFGNLANLLLVAATSGLSWRNGSREALHARVWATDLETGREIQGESRFSYANL